MSNINKNKEILTGNQLGYAKRWYKKHKKELKKLITSTHKRYPPSDDIKKTPSLWSAPNWRWLLYPTDEYEY